MYTPSTAVTTVRTRRYFSSRAARIPRFCVVSSAPLPVQTTQDSSIRVQCLPLFPNGPIFLNPSSSFVSCNSSSTISKTISPTASLPNSQLFLLYLSSTYPKVKPSHFLFSLFTVFSISIRTIRYSTLDIFRRVDRYFLGRWGRKDRQSRVEIDVETLCRVVVLLPLPNPRPCPLAANSKYSGRKPWR